MGVRLVKYINGYISDGISEGTFYHDELVNRDADNQHPISAITNLQETLTGLQETLDKANAIISTLVKSYKDSMSIHFDVDEETGTLAANVKIYESKDNTNAIIETTTGLYVPKTMTEDTDTITWVTETKGESLSEIFNNGMVFSHQNSWSNVYNDSEANAWYWDDNLQSFVQPKNTSSFTGFVTNNFYDNYIHTTTLKSTDSDNDLNGLIIGFVFDEENKPHTLSAIVDSGGVDARWAVIYDYMLPDQQILFSSGNGENGTIPSNRGSNWSTRSGITINITKYGNLVTCTCSNWGDTALNELTKISIDLNDYEWGHLFSEQVRYGYCNYSQPYSYFSDISFTSKNMATSQTLFASVKISSETGNKIVKREDGLYCGDGGESNSNVLEIEQSNHGLVVGNIVYLKSDGLYAMAFAEDTNRIEVIGIVTKVTDENNFIVTVSGEFKTDMYNSYVNGTVLYLSDKIEGVLTNLQGNYVKPIAIKISTGILINIQRANAYSLENSVALENYTSKEITDAIENLWSE